MKSYFNFLLGGKQLLPAWSLLYISIITVCIIALINPNSQDYPINTTLSVILLTLFMYFFIIFIIAIISFYFAKKFIQNIAVKEITIQCDYSFAEYLSICFLGSFLTIITIGIYYPWFLRNIYRFFIDNSSYNNNYFSFQGKGGNLFGIMFLSLFLPYLILTILKISIYGIDYEETQPLYSSVLEQAILFLISVPYTYLVYKWLINIFFKAYNIRLHTDFFPSVGKIAYEYLLSIITLGIYFPMAYLRIYDYFIKSVETNAYENKMYKFGYDIEPKKDFLLIWGQILLTIITIGIYLPWAVCKIGKRILSKTYVEQIEVLY